MKQKKTLKLTDPFEGAVVDQIEVFFRAPPAAGQGCAKMPHRSEPQEVGPCQNHRREDGFTDVPAEKSLPPRAAKAPSGDRITLLYNHPA